MLPAARSTLPHTVLLEASSSRRDPLDLEEQLLRFVAAAVRALSGAAAVPSASRRRTRAASAGRCATSRTIPAEALDLDRLASIAATSKFHFLRIFRRAVGLTPYQFLLNTRLRRAALGCSPRRDAVSAIAFDSGFGDLSTFNAAFRGRFGSPPLAFRRKQRGSTDRARASYCHSHADSAWHGRTGRHPPCPPRQKSVTRRPSGRLRGHRPEIASVDFQICMQARRRTLSGMNRPLPPRKSKSPRATRLMAIDAWIDSTLYEAGFKAREIWETLTIFFRRFRFTGWKRGGFELLGEGFTMGAAGCVVMLALALPAFEETEGNWRAQDDFAVTFLDRQGNEIGQRGIIQRESIPVDEMPDHVIKAVLATEDRRFFEHYGIDFLGLMRAMSENVRANSVVQGGSSLTQQLAKNLFLSNERTIERKVKEAFLAVWLEMNLSKKEILQLYLDRAYMGGGTFGITAAADFYFGKSVKDLNLAEAAMLAGLFKAPAKYAPHVNLPAARARANVVLTNLVQGGFMTDGQVLQARLHPADIVDRGDRKSPDYFLDWAFEEVKRLDRQVGRALDGRAHHHRHEPAARGRRIRRVQSAPARRRIRRHRRRDGGHGSRRRGARHRRRPRLRRQPVQPRHQGAAPDRLVLQALCLRHRDGARLHAGLGRLRRPDHLGQMVAEELRRAAMPAAWT